MEELTRATVYAQAAAPTFTIAALALLLVVTLPGSAFVGFLLGHRKWERAPEHQRERLSRAGETTTGAMLALFGLLVGFSYANGLGWAHQRQAAILTEANALGTAFLRADLLPEPGARALKQALADYTRTRFMTRAALEEAGSFAAYIERTLAAQDRLWPLTVAATDPPVPAPVRTFVAGAVNDVIDAHAIRAATIYNPVADVAGLMVLATAVTALFFMGNRAGLQGRPLTWRTFVLAGFVLVVLLTILDLQRGLEGAIQVNYDVLRATLLDMEAALAAPG